MGLPDASFTSIQKLCSHSCKGCRLCLQVAAAVADVSALERVLTPAALTNEFSHDIAAAPLMVVDTNVSPAALQVETHCESADTGVQAFNCQTRDAAALSPNPQGLCRLSYALADLRAAKLSAPAACQCAAVEIYLIKACAGGMQICGGGGGAGVAGAGFGAKVH